MAFETTELSLASLELDKLEVCVELMFYAAYADGVVDEKERQAFEKHVVQATGGQLGPALVQAVLKHIEGSVQKAGVTDRNVRVRAMAVRLGDAKLRHAALSLAVAVAKADGDLSEVERAFLVDTAAAFGLSKADVHID